MKRTDIKEEKKDNESGVHFRLYLQKAPLCE